MTASLIMRWFNAAEKGKLLKRRAGRLQSGYHLLINLQILKVKVKDKRDRGARRQVFVISRWPLLLLEMWTITTLTALITPTTLFSRVVRIIISNVVPLKLIKLLLP